METISYALEKISDKIKDATPSQVKRFVEKNRGELRRKSLVRKLLDFEGVTIADLSYHLQSRNASCSKQLLDTGRTRSSEKLNLDDLEKRGGKPYSNKGNKHEF